ncbi:MAG: GIY-YIG nuclease family protein [Bacteroidales bacterium]|nr:GIY-YIG nuclease family protein [Bacteroidales bacterium]
MKGYVYKYTFSNGKIYVGQTRRDVNVRHREHMNPSTGPLNPRFWQAYQELGEPKLEIIKEIEEENNYALIQALNRCETYYIKKWKSDDLDFGYNVKSSGTTYCPDKAYLDDEFREIWTKIAQEGYSLFHSVYDKIENSCHEDLTEEEKGFIKNSLLSNNIFSNSLNDVMDSHDYSIEDKDGLFWLDEAIDFAKMIFNEEHWAMIDKYIAHNRETIIEKRTRHKIVQQLSLQGDLIKEYRSIDEVREALSLTRTDNIMNVIKGRQKTAYGYVWRRASDVE